jgi:mRNA-degrading endonuclease YafQ of YafQ-DinJ toxin-antitoxin module
MEKLKDVMRMLIYGEPLESRYHDHALFERPWKLSYRVP